MKTENFGQTHQGLVRKKNDDSFLENLDLQLFVLCDGVSGHVEGKLASQMAAEEVQRYLTEGRGIIDRYKSDRSPKNRSQVSTLVVQAIQSANKKIFTDAQADHSKNGMSTTVDVLLLIDDYAVIGHVGDSRVYKIRNRQTHLLTDDHSVAAEMVRQGVWTLAEAMSSPHAHTLSRAVGIQPFVQVDTLEVELAKGDMFVLCSDGLSNYFKDGQELNQYVALHDPKKISDALVQFALKQGGGDNVTVEVVLVEDLQLPQTSQVNVTEKFEIFRQIPLFKYLGHKELARVLSLTSTVQFQKGVTMLQEGSPGTQIFVILSGSVELKKGDLKLSPRGKGEVLGEMAIIDNSPRSASVYAAEQTECLVIEQKDLFVLMRKEPQLAVKLVWSLSQSLNQRLRSTTEQLADAKASLDTLKGGITEVPFLNTEK